MSQYALDFIERCKKSDSERDKNLHDREDVRILKDIPYAEGGEYNLLDIYYPLEHKLCYPVIVSVHGGGYVYGSKREYYYYGQYLASLGFAVVNFNYHLAPEYQFPAQLEELNFVMKWIKEFAERYSFDLKNLFIVGDSAGAQIASHYLVIATNEDFAKRFTFRVPQDLVVNAVAFNCGMYDISVDAEKEFERMKKEKGLDTYTLLQDYMGNSPIVFEKQREIFPNITAQFPPTYLMTAQYDFLKEMALPMKMVLQEAGVPVEYKVYGAEGENYMGHVFHLNMNLEEAFLCNQEEIEFFKKYMK